jgi:hypothetical protein
MADSSVDVFVVEKFLSSEVACKIAKGDIAFTNFYCSVWFFPIFATLKGCLMQQRCIEIQAEIIPVAASSVAYT